MTSDEKRYINTAADLLKLGATTYCDCGPGAGEIAIKLKAAGKNVIGLEAPWDFEIRTAWAKEHDIKIYPGEFFNTDFSKAIPEKVNCFSLIHCIAHFRYAPQVMFEQVYNKLEKGGFFYLSTVNGGSLDRVLKLLRGGALTEEVVKDVKMDDMYYKFYNPTGKHMIWDNWMHVKEYRAFELKKMFEAEKFKVVELKHRNNYSELKNNLVCGVWPHLSEEIIIIGQKI